MLSLKIIFFYSNHFMIQVCSSFALPATADEKNNNFCSKTKKSRHNFIFYFFRRMLAKKWKVVCWTKERKKCIQFIKKECRMCCLWRRWLCCCSLLPLVNFCYTNWNDICFCRHFCCSFNQFVVFFFITRWEI